MSTFNARLAGKCQDVALWVTIEGIAPIFKTHATLNCSTILGATRAEYATLVDVDEGDTRIDFEQMRQAGGGLSFRICQPYGSAVLDDLFQPRKRRITWLTSGIDDADTSIEVDDTGALGADDLIYIGNETIKIGGTASSPTRFTGCTRAMYGSRAQAHKSSSSVLGASVYDVPPQWMHRRATLRASFLLHDGTSTADLTQTIGTFVIEENPQWDAASESLSFRCGPLIDEYMNRSAYVGLREVGAGAAELDALGTTVNVEVDDARQFTVPTSGFPTFALLSGDGFGSVVRLYDYDTVLSRVNAGLQDFMDPPWIFASVSGSGPSSGTGAGRASISVPYSHARHIALVSGSTGQWMLWLLCSRLGDNANGSYDQLPGLERTALEDPEFRMGCGILEADIDVDAFNGMSGTWVTYPLMKECKASDILREGCLALEAFAFVNADGQLTLARLGDSRDTPVITLTSAYTMPDEQAKVYVDEESIHPVVKWRANFDPVENDFDLEHITIDAELLQRYPNKDDPFEIESRGIGVDVPVQLRDKQRLARGFPMSLSMLDQKARSFQVRGGRGRLIVERTFRLAAVAARVGDVVSIGFEGPDLEGGSINGRLARVVGRRPRWRSNAVDLVLEVFEAVYRVAPSSIIAAVSTTDSANDTIELSTSDPDHASTSPQDDFHVGQLVRIWDMSAAAYEDAEIASILSGPPRLVFTGSLALTVETGRDWVTWGPLGTSDGTTANGDDESDWLYQMANDGVAAEGATRRWQ